MMNRTNRTSSHQDLAVIRISDSTAMKELEKKVRETAAMHASLPGAEMLARLGARPLQHPEEVDGRLYTCPGFRAVHFRLPGTKTWVLLALGSATKINFGEDDNAFVRLLGSILAESRITSLWVADFARLLRSIDYLSDTWKAVRTGCRYVRHAGAVIDTAGPSAEIQFLFEALSAAAEARAVVKRTTTGKMRAHVDGRCPLGRESVPLGYTKSKKGHLGLADPVPATIVRTIVQVLGDPTLTNRDRVEKVAAQGAVSLASSRQRQAPVSVADLGNPSDVVGRWYEALDVWRTGRWTVDMQLPALLHTTIFDLPVDICEEGDGRVWRMDFDLPLPDGGWASDDEFDAAIALRDSRAEHTTPTGGAAPGHARKPFTGLSAWEHDGMQYVLLSHRRGTYELRRRPIADSQTQRVIDGEPRWVAKGWGRRPNLDGEQVAIISAEILHGEVVHALVAAAEHGLALTLASAAVLEKTGEVGNELRAQLSGVRRRAANARRNANEAATEADRRKSLSEQTAAAAEAAMLEADIFRLLGEGGRLQVDAETVAAALAAVAEQPDHVPAEVADALRTVLSGFRLEPIDDDTLVWRVSLRVPMFGGTLTLGPASGRLSTGAKRELAAKRTASLTSRAEEAAAQFMAHTLTISETSTHLGIRTPRRVEQTIRDYLQLKGLSSEMASYVVAHGSPPARRVIWERLHDRPYPRDVDQRFAVAVKGAYLDPEARAKSRKPKSLSMRRSLLQAVQDAGGWVPEEDVDDVCARVGLRPCTLTELMEGRQRGGLWHPPILRAYEDGVALIPCPHKTCGGWAIVLARHPEVATDVLCDVCMRMPDPKSKAVFPDDYR